MVRKEIKEAKMAKKEAFFQVSSVRALGAFVSMLWVVGIAGFIVYAGLIVVSALKSQPGMALGKRIVSGPALGLGAAGLLTLAVFLWIIFHLKKLLRTVERGTPFAKDNPRWIRRVAYGVFAWMPLQIISKILLMGLAEAVMPGNFIDLLLRDFLMPIFLGTAVLVIARVFETGVRLQQDQSLTI